MAGIVQAWKIAPDLTKVQNPKDSEIVKILKEKYSTDLTYSDIGFSYLLSINPCKPVASNEARAEAFSLREVCCNEKPPHPYGLAANAYMQMICSEESQVIIAQGESGSGKTEALKLVLKQVLNLSKNDGSSELDLDVYNALVLLEAFGHAKTATNPNASRIGKCVEIQYGEAGMVTGAKFLDYGLEKSRLLGSAENERNFHVFYNMLAGATSEEKTQWHLDQPQKFAFLKKSKCFTVPGLDDAKNFNVIKTMMRTLGIGKRVQNQLFQVLSALLHLGNIEFQKDGYKKDDAALIENRIPLEAAANLMGVSAESLEAALTCKTSVVGGNLYTDFLTPDQANSVRNNFSCSLYELLVTWIVDFINNRLVDDSATKVISLIDFPGSESLTGQGHSSFHQLCVNYMAERLQHSFDFFLAKEYDFMVTEKVKIQDPAFFRGTSEVVQFLEARPGGFIALLDDQSQKPKELGRDIQVLNLAQKEHSTNGKQGVFGWNSSVGTFKVKHFFGPIIYQIDGFVVQNTNSIVPDLVRLIRSNTTKNSFLRSLFSDSSIQIETHLKNATAVVRATSVRLRRAPSRRQRTGISPANSPRTTSTANSPTTPSGTFQPSQLPPQVSAEIAYGQSVMSTLRSGLDELFESMSDMRQWRILCVRPNDKFKADDFNTDVVKTQLQSLGLFNAIQVYKDVHPIAFNFSTFTQKYAKVLYSGTDSNTFGKDLKSMCTELLGTKIPAQALVTDKYVFLSASLWRELESKFDGSKDVASRSIMIDELLAPTHGRTEVDDIYSPTTLNATRFTGRSKRGSNVEQAISSKKRKKQDDQEEAEEKKEKENKKREKEIKRKNEEEQKKRKRPMTLKRKWWVRFSNCSTCLFPECCLKKIGRMDKLEIREAWREKVALCVMIFFMSGAMIFFIQGLSYIFCPSSKMFSVEEIQAHNRESDGWVIINGRVFDVTGFAAHLGADIQQVNGSETITKFVGRSLGQDLSPHFLPFVKDLQQAENDDQIGGLPRSCLKASSTQRTARAVIPMQSTESDDINDTETFTLQKRDNVAMPKAEDLILVDRNAICKRKGETSAYCHRRVDLIKANNEFYVTSGFKPAGFVAYAAVDVHSRQTIDDAWIQFDGSVYSFAPLFKYQILLQGTIFEGYGSDIIKYIYTSLGRDAKDGTKFKLTNGMTFAQWFQANAKCFDDAFLIGKIDNRNTIQCLISSNLLLAVTAAVVSVMVIKFLTALLQIGSVRVPEHAQKYVMLQVPCYTEGEESLRKTIDSLSITEYDDDKKLLFIIADGLVKGSGNDRPTAEVLLDVLGVEDEKREALSYIAIGDGSKQHNRAKVYAGFYSIHARRIPYITIVKCGTETELNRPGNRGKRDSQMILMKFLNKVHYQSPMTPLELEMYRVIVDTFGVDPIVYEYCLMVDADTEVMPDSLLRLISSCINDTKIMGICGETLIANERSSWVTMVQVYEYYISHHLSKAFESTFGSVTCLPGCFCMYRIRCPNKFSPLLISSDVIQEYENNVVDTLHLKNLLSLGEDRFLTTLMLKYFPGYRNKFVPDAQCKTIVPESFLVLLSQRRRWINSTIHNMFELVFLPDLCGCLCFSMRLVVFLDLFATLVMPASVAYLGYVIYIAVTRGGLETISILMISAAYAFQALIFIFKGQVQHIGWMLVSLLAMPVFNFFLPLYAFWHFDDFSWGNTRRIAGMAGGGHDGDGDVFDPTTIPTQTWSKFTAETKPFESSVAPVVTKTSAKDRRMSRNPAIEMGKRVSLAMLSTDRNSKFLLGELTEQESNNDDESDSTMRQRTSPTKTRGTFGPSDQEIIRQIQTIIKNTDLSQLSKKLVREKLNVHFGVDMILKKEFINNEIGRAVKEHASK